MRLHEVEPCQTGDILGRLACTVCNAISFRLLLRAFGGGRTKAVRPAPAVQLILVRCASGTIQNVPHAPSAWCTGPCGAGRQAFETPHPPDAAGLMDVKQGIIDRCDPSSRNRCAKTTLLSFSCNVFNLSSRLHRICGKNTTKKSIVAFLQNELRALEQHVISATGCGSSHLKFFTTTSCRRNK